MKKHYGTCNNWIEVLKNRLPYRETFIVNGLSDMLALGDCQVFVTTFFAKPGTKHEILISDPRTPNNRLTTLIQFESPSRTEDIYIH